MKKNSLSKLLVLAVIMLSSLVFTSCASKEERNIAALRDLVEKVESKGADMDEKAWSEVIEQNNTILNEDSKDCNYTQEQKAEITKLEARFAAASAKAVGKKVGKGLMDAVEGASDFVNGVVDGFKDE